MASESLFRKTNHKNKLKVGPGVDYWGQMPIPQDMMMKRGTPVRKNKKVSFDDNKKKKEN